MKRRRAGPAALGFLAAMAMAVGSAKAGSSPQAATQDFLDWHARPSAGTFSSKENAGRLSSLMTRELLCLLRATDRYRDHYVKADPEGKPPYADGDLFVSSVWEPPVGADIVVARTYGVDAEVWVRFVDSDGTRWHDRFRLRQENGDWKVADIDRLGWFENPEGKVSVGKPDSLVKSLYREMDSNRPLVHWRRHEVSACRRGR